MQRKRRGTFHVARTFREYEVREAEGGYELLKEGEAVGIFSEAKVEKDRIVFKLSHGMNLEGSEKGVRETFSPGRAELCGLIAADGTVCKYERTHEVSFKNEDRELTNTFCELVKEFFDTIPHLYFARHITKEGEEREYCRATIYSKKVAYDLWMFSVKGPAIMSFTRL
ncbi:MAG: LAGLIDADG family homing endonuclease [Candidatus Brockarchaeota archaeon]|nr:LAGLIDADG family homing endonuclease [Candidatus Brockarchaeota archaeon]MBO3808065.1 LAGLIDADG family homing endonuclease [Candidatus Brockarchaeota archaeon]